MAVEVGEVIKAGFIGNLGNGLVRGHEYATAFAKPDLSQIAAEGSANMTSEKSFERSWTEVRHARNFTQTQLLSELFVDAGKDVAHPF